MSDTTIEIDGGQVTRPERIILPGVAGIAVPLLVREKDELTYGWRMMLRWQDGRREQVPISDCLQVGGQLLFLRPRPGAPQAALFDRWPRRARESWLRGDASMPPDEVCKLLLTAFAKHLELPASTAAGTVAVLACWTVLTYIYPAFDAVPYLAIGGTLGSGKTRVLDLLEQVVFRPFVTSSVSNSALFRHLDALGGTMLIDEGEHFRTRSPEVAETFNSILAGYKRGKTVSRSESKGNGDYRPRQYCVFGPKAIACINEILPALASRAVPVRMIRAPGDSPKIRLRTESSRSEWATLRDALHAMALDFNEEWLALPTKEHVCPEMPPRDYEIWQPLLAIADWLDRRGASGLYENLREHALRTIEGSSDAAVPGEDEVLLRALTRMIRGDLRPTAKDVLRQAEDDEPSLFRNWSAKRVANHLRQYGLSSRKTAGEHVFDPSLDALARIQSVYQIDLNLPKAPAIDTQLPLPLDGARGARGAHVQQGV